jgi:putative ABC transport system permease protein
MNVLLTMRVALRALGKNKLRASLTVLGVVIGIAAVTAMVSIGQSASKLVEFQFQSLGTNFMVIIPGSQTPGGVRQGAGTVPTLTARDMAAIVEECPAVLAATPSINARSQIIYGNCNWYPDELVGVGAAYPLVRNWQIRRGGFFSEREIYTAAKVCVIGQTIVEKLFQTSDPIGKTLRIKNIPFRVIGILQAKGANIIGEDQDNIVLAPYTTVRKRLQGSTFENVGVILVSARSLERMADAKQEIRQLLQQRHHIHPGTPDDFTIRDITEIANMWGTITNVMTLLLASIAGISLLVGGVGIMNIMLVSVTERTREIGIRMAVGARGRDILRQFLVEAVLLSSLGGVVGVILGVAGSVGITAAINSFSSGTPWPTVVSFKAAAIAMAFAAAVGIFFGYYPALRASRLDPIDALRYE